MPAWGEAAVAATARRVRLALDPRRRRFGSGNRLGSGPGASLEFHDHRAYVAGDDLRHLDWGVYARSDQLVLRRHRVEVSPTVEVLLDLSLSMAGDPAKAALATSLAALLATLAEADGTRPRVWAFSDEARRMGARAAGAWRAELSAAKAAGAAGLLARPPGLAPGSERLLVSDGLVAEGGAAVVRALGAGAGRIALVQVLTRTELAPEPLGAVRLEDVEGGVVDLVHDHTAVAAYRDRLARHQAGWQAALAGRGAGVVTCVVEDGLDAAVDLLLRAGLLAVRAG